MSPSLWSLVLRLAWQYQCSKPREFDSSRSLRFFCLGAVFFNASSMWHHARDGAAEGRTIILDFVGMSFTPSKLQLLTLDFLILFLQLILTNIAYEHSLAGTEGEEDTLAPIPTSNSPSPSPLPTDAEALSPISTPPSSNLDPKCVSPPKTESPYVLDLRLSSTVARLRRPPPHPSSSTDDSLLPLPNTTPWPLPPSIRMLMRANSQMRRSVAQTQTRGGSGEDTMDNTRREGRIPGGLDDQLA